MDTDTTADQKRIISEHETTIAKLKAQLAKTEKLNNKLLREAKDLKTANTAQQKKLHDFSSKQDKVTTKLDEVFTKVDKVAVQTEKEMSGLRAEREEAMADFKNLKALLDESLATQGVDVAQHS